MASTAVESSGASIDALKEGQACQTPIPSDAKLGRFFRPSVVDLEGQEREGRARAYLEEQAHWAAGLLGDLIEGKAAGEYDRLNAQVLNSCEGLSFIDVRKGGFGLTVGHGYGFVIKKLSQDHHGNSLWSQPLFFMVSQAGLGVSAGYQHCQSVIALLSIGSVDIFKNGTRSLGTELGLFSTDGALMGMSGGAALGASQHLGISVANTHSAFCYSKVDGVYLELSMHGSSVTPDGESNRALYGDNYNPEEVLSRRGEALPSLLPLLRTINTYGKMAMAGRPVQQEVQLTA